MGGSLERLSVLTIYGVGGLIIGWVNLGDSPLSRNIVKDLSRKVGPVAGMGLVPEGRIRVLE